MGTYTKSVSAKADDPIYSSGPQVHFKPPSTPSTSATPPSTAGGPQPGRKSGLPPSPKREDFKTQEAYEEALGGWQSRIGRIKGLADLVRRTEASKDSPDK